ncbi:hypothetical protein H4R33_004147 [Dimargaris cristalligena]|uniref:MARVEL domain-containing protein n=1 Tax=Dimargaris cristalligena TaxID=215637 RepID=A0A4P9ZZP8_9FUNG|nr:hypothetical protein H4R33_004147 [Dimargaris cristalligena]RKP38310.1 hypothetical protein BJ085DRAFT_29564 [Dimargaris cristalligena]|eukprot:RKP38310.1 hypothetical protein BJ085DRAFT_29564 [Dimargaris cristalligena]
MAVISYNFYDRVRLISLSAGGLCAFMVMCFGARVADWAQGWTPSAFKFIIFNAVFSLLLVALMASAPWLHARSGLPYFRRLIEPLAEAVLTGVLSIFWFSGFIAITVARPVDCPDSVCGVARGAIAFAFFAFVFFGLLFGIRLRDYLCRTPHLPEHDHADKGKFTSGIYSTSLPVPSEASPASSTTHIDMPSPPGEDLNPVVPSPVPPLPSTPMPTYQAP